MADFCKQCSIELFGGDGKDLAGLGETKPGFGWPVLCEGCGGTLVNNEGECIANCLKHHNEEHDHE